MIRPIKIFQRMSNLDIARTAMATRSWTNHSLTFRYMYILLAAAELKSEITLKQTRTNSTAKFRLNHTIDWDIGER